MNAGGRKAIPAPPPTFLTGGGAGAPPPVPTPMMMTLYSTYMYVYFHDGKIKVKPTLPISCENINLKNANIFVLSGTKQHVFNSHHFNSIKNRTLQPVIGIPKDKAYHSTVQSIHKQNHKVAWFYRYFKYSVLFNMISRKCCNVMIIIKYRR